MQPRYVFRATVAFVAIAIAVVLVAMGWTIARSPLVLTRHQLSHPEIVRFVPKRAAGFALLDAELPQVERLRQFVTPPSQRRRAHRQWRRALSATGDGAIAAWLEASDIDFKRDIQSWLGSVGLVAELAPSISNEPDFMLVMSTDDVHQSSRILNAWWQELYLQGKPPQNETYKGVQVFQLPVQAPKDAEGNRWQTVAAVGDRYVVFASSDAAMKDAIDSWQIPELSLAFDEYYRKVAEELSGNGIGWAYINASRAGWRSSVDADLAWPSAAGDVSAVGLSYRLAADGPQVRTVMVGDDVDIASEFEPVEHLPGVLLGLIERESRSLWLQVRRSIGQTEGTASLTRALDSDLGRMGT